MLEVCLTYTNSENDGSTLSTKWKYRKYTDVPIFCLQHPILHFLPFSVVVHVVSGFLPTYKINLFLIANRAHFFFCLLTTSNLMLYVQIFSYVFSKARKVSSKMDLNILVALAAYVSQQTIAAEKKTIFFAKICCNCMFYSIPN